jgi:hypothetical protein
MKEGFWKRDGKMNACRKSSKLQMKLLCLLAGVCLATSAQAELYILSRITNNSGGDLGYFSIEILPQGMNQVEMTFTNQTTTDGVVTALYMNESSWLDYVDITSQYDAGQDEYLNTWTFTPNGDKNAMLPGGNEYGFTPQTTFCLRADPARPKNGLEAGDHITLLFELTNPTDFDFDDLVNSINQQELGVGIHVQALPLGTSDAFVTVPEPVTIALLGTGALLIYRKKRGTAQ